MLKIKIAKSFFSRFIGLMGKKNLPKETGLLIAPCQSIHMMFMRFSIDAVYIDKNFVIKKIVPNLKTWIGISICTSAWGVIELAAGEAERLNLKVGEKLTVEIVTKI
ncbi:MAG: DUF192 domain-containing protein [Selenomonadaceae bacterium]|nr:DUF192 domain-containing protein [Selenomonadaceae bacterium]